MLGINPGMVSSRRFWSSRAESFPADDKSVSRFSERICARLILRTGRHCAEHVLIGSQQFPHDRIFDRLPIDWANSSHSRRYLSCSGSRKAWKLRLLMCCYCRPDFLGSWSNGESQPACRVWIIQDLRRALINPNCNFEGRQGKGSVHPSARQYWRYCHAIHGHFVWWKFYQEKTASVARGEMEPLEITCWEKVIALNSITWIALIIPHFEEGIERIGYWRFWHSWLEIWCE